MIIAGYDPGTLSVAAFKKNYGKDGQEFAGF
jgi:hypothetical protein